MKSIKELKDQYKRLQVRGYKRLFNEVGEKVKVRIKGNHIGETFGKRKVKRILRFRESHGTLEFFVKYKGLKVPISKNHNSINLDQLHEKQEIIKEIAKEIKYKENKN